MAGGADIYNCDFFGCQTLSGCPNLTVYGEGYNNFLSKLAENFGLSYKDVSKESEKVLGVTFKDTIINIDKKETLSINAVVYPKVKANEQLSFVSSDESIATVDSKGNVTGVKCGTCYITATSKDGAYARCQINVKHIEKTKVTAATTNKAGKIVTYCGECDKNISSVSISKIKEAKLSYQSKLYTGKKLASTVQVKNSSGKKINSKYYTVSYKNNENVGVATVIIKFKGNYSGTVEKTFTIRPDKTKIVRLTSKSKGFDITWKKQSTQVTGYEIEYSTNSKFTKKTTKNIKIAKSSTTSKKIRKLKTGKKYYVRIRTYKKIKLDGKSTSIYSNWSATKTIKTKK